MDPEELSEGVSIASLVCPLRYDVLVRRDFFQLYVANRDLYRKDRPAFLDLVRAGSYHRWWIHSEAVWTRLSRRVEPERLDALLVDRVERAVSLFDSVDRHGFRDVPITLLTAQELLPPIAEPDGEPTGKTLESRYFLGDGCHRLAILMLRGMTTLERPYFRVKAFARYSPFDSTSILTRVLGLSEASYFAYLSTLYCSPRIFTDRIAFLDDVGHRHPEMMTGVLSVIAADGFGEQDRGSDDGSPSSATS